MPLSLSLTPRPADAPAREPATVLCVHAFGGSATQYHGLVTRLEPRLRVRPVDLYGHGRRAPWLAPRRFTVADEAAALLSLLPGDGPVHLVGHSYGGAVALRLAAMLGRRVRSMALYEPAAWGLLSACCPGDAATQEIESVRARTDALLAEGALEAAAEAFVDYWNGPGQWAAMAPARRPRVLATMHSLPAVWQAIFDERWSVAELGAIGVPCLVMSGTASTAAARRTAALLRTLLPGARALDFDGLGHLGPITHPAAVDAAVDTFLTEPRRLP